MIKYFYSSFVLLSSFSYASESGFGTSQEHGPEWYRHHMILIENSKNKRNSRRLSEKNQEKGDDQILCKQEIFCNNSNSKKL